MFKTKLQQRAVKSVSTKVIGKFSPYGIILSPVITEKTHSQQESDSKYTFKINKDANKNDVKQAIKYLYNIEPLKINISNAKFKIRQQKGMVKRSYKKAIVTLSKKDKIELS